MCLRFWLSWLEGPREVKVATGRGYFNCPYCRSRQPCQLSQVLSRTYMLRGFPMSHGEPVGPEQYLCLQCKREYTADGIHGFDYGPNAAPQTWRCFQCNGEVPYEKFDCPHCGYRFKVSGRGY
jgi:DNA-directed RNA polymerase subunit RPC12/RpoP